MAKLYILNGPDKGRAFELKAETSYIGRSSENDISIRDLTVSRRHLKIIAKGEKYYLVDLKSMNGTFYNGSYIAPGIEIEVKKGIPIVIGMSVIGVGETSVDIISPFLDSIGITAENQEEIDKSLNKRNKSNQKKLELIYLVSKTLEANMPVRETLHQILGHIFDLLKRIDKGAFILIDPTTKKIASVISRSNILLDQSSDQYCKAIIERVLAEKKLVAISSVRTEEQNELVNTLHVFRIESVMCLPLMTSSELIGVMYLDSEKNPIGFRKGDSFLLKDLSQRIALYLEDAYLHQLPA